MSKRFKRQESWKYKRLDDRWRKARGAKNPYTRPSAGKPAIPRDGYGSPAATRGLHPSGLREVRVFTPSELEGLDNKKIIVRIGGSVGGRKKLLIWTKAKELKLRVIQNEPNSSKKDSK